MDQENVKRANSHLSVCHREKGLRLRVTNVTCCQQNAIKPRGQQPVAVSCRHAAADAQHQKSCRPLGCDDSRVQPRAEITGAVQLQRTAKGTTNVRGSAVQPPQVISRPQPIADVDWNDRGDPQLCAEYVTDIYNHLVHEERKPHYTVRPKFLDEQLGIRAHHRTVLVDWLVLVSDKLQLSNVTLHAMVDLMDRYLQTQQVSKQRLQLVGVTSMLLACKYEEIRCPSVHDMIYVTDDAYTTKDIRAMELDILRAVEYRMSKPVVLEFLRRYSKVAQAVATEHHLAKYFLELALLDDSLSPFHPSKKAAAAFLLARTVHLCLDPAKVWTPKLVHYSGYQLKDLTGTMDLLKGAVRSWHSHLKLTAVHNKYSGDAFGRVSSLPALRYL